MRKLILTVIILVTLESVALAEDSPDSTSSCGVTKCSQGEFLAEYYKGSSFNYLSCIRCEFKPKNRNWLLMDDLPEGVGPDNFSVRWKGRFSFQDKKYIFEAKAKAGEGIRVWLDEEQIIDKWSKEKSKILPVTRSLKEGIYEIKVEYCNRSGEVVANFSWEKKRWYQIIGTF